MYGAYKISFLDKNKNEKKSIYQKNKITANGRKKILDMLSYNPVDTFGYKKAEKIYEGTLVKDGKKRNYKSSFFGWKKTNHPFLETSEFSEVGYAKEVLTENGSLDERSADRILKTDNRLRISWGKNKSGISELNSYKTWFVIALGIVEEVEEFALPIKDNSSSSSSSSTNESSSSSSSIINDDNQIKLFGSPIYKVEKVVSTNHNSPITYKEGSDYSIDYENGILTVSDEMRKNLGGENEIIRNEIEITYTWNGSRYIDELKNGICGVYVNAQPSVKSDSSSFGINNYFGMGTFSYDNGKTWQGYSFPWKGQPLTEINKFTSYNNNAYVGKNMTAFFSLNTEFEHCFPTFPYSFISPTNFAFAFCTDEKNPFHIKNLNFLVPDFPPPTLQEIELSNGKNSVKKQIEWSGVGNDDDGNVYAEWKTYLDLDEGNDITFTKINTYFSEKIYEIGDDYKGWVEMTYPETGKIDFSEATLENPIEKIEDDLIEISYRIYFDEISGETEQ